MSEGTGTAEATSTAENQGSGAEGAAGGESKGSFLGTEGGAGEAASTGTAEKPTGLVEVFGEKVLENGAFREGYAETFREAGLERLANKAQLTKDPQALLKTLDDALGLVGKKQVGSFPDASWTPEQVADWRATAGLPDSPEGYRFEHEGKTVEGDHVKEIAEILHKHHARPELAGELVAWQTKQETAAAEAQAEGFREKVGEMGRASEERFRGEWGEGYEARLQANRDYVKTVFSKEELADPLVQAALSHPKIVAAFDLERQQLRNGGGGRGLPGVGAETSGHAMSPREQANEIMREDSQWRSKPEKAKRVQQLFALHAQQAKRK